MVDLLSIEARDGKLVKFLSQEKAQVFGKLGELICQDADVIYSGTDPAKARKMLEKQNKFWINIEQNSKGKLFVVVGPYGLKGGGCFSSRAHWTQLTKQINDQPVQTYRALNKEQRELQPEIAENLARLLDGAQNGIIENIVESIKNLENISLGDFGSPHISSKKLLECLMEGGMWQDEWVYIRKEIGRMAKLLLFYGHHISKNRVTFFKENKDEFLSLANSIENRILNDEKKFVENGLLCDIKTIKIGINQRRTNERWYIKWYAHGKHLMDCIVKKDIESGLQFIQDILNISIEKMHYNLPWISMILEYLKELGKSDINAYDELHNFLNCYQSSNWKILYMILDHIEAVILDKRLDVTIRQRFLEGNQEKNYPGFLEFAGFDKYWFKNNWRIREKAASGLAKLLICDNDSFIQKAKDKIAERITHEKNLKVKEILENPKSVQIAQELFERTWDIRREPLEDLKEKVVNFIVKSDENIEFIIFRISELFLKFDHLEEQQKLRFDNLEEQQKLRFEEQQKFTTENINKKIDDFKTENDKKICILSTISEIGFMNNTLKKQQCKVYKKREQEIRDLGKYIPNKKFWGVKQIAIVAGEGAGKSELALEFVKTYQNNFGVIWWIDASNKVKIENSYLEMAEARGILHPSLFQKDIITQLIKILARQKYNWLIIFDNASNPELVSAYMPESRGVALITSKNQKDWNTVAQSPDRCIVYKLTSYRQWIEAIENAKNNAALQDLRHKRSEILNSYNNPNLENAFRTTCSAYGSNFMEYNSSVQMAYKDYTNIYHQKISLFNTFEESRSSILWIYNTETNAQASKPLDICETLDYGTCITQLQNGKLFCFGNCLAYEQGITLLINVYDNYKVTKLQSGTKCYMSSAIYFNNYVYCFGGHWDKGDLTHSRRYDLVGNQWSPPNELAQLPKADFACSCIIFDRSILIAGYNNTHILRFSINQNSFTEIPQKFGYLKRKILINSKNLYLIECCGDIWESAPQSDTVWSQISNSPINFWPNQVYCQYNKGEVYISCLEVDLSTMSYFKFNLKEKSLYQID